MYYFNYITLTLKLFPGLYNLFYIFFFIRTCNLYYDINFINNINQIDFIH